VKRILKSPYLFLFISLATLAGIDHYLIKDSHAYMNINPNPYMILAVIMAALFGLKVAIISSIACATVFLIDLHSNLNYQEVETIFDFQFLSIPLMLSITAVIVGELRHRSLERIQKYKKIISNYEKSESYLQNKETIHQKEIAELKKRLVSKLETVRSFYEIAKSLYTVDQKELLHNFLKVLHKQFKVDEMAVYGVDSNEETFTLLSRTEKGHFADTMTLPELDVICAQATKLRKLVTIEDVYSLEKFNESRSSSLLASPVILQGKVAYLIVIHEIPFLEYIPSNFKIFELYSDWLASALTYAKLYHHSLNHNIWNEALNIYRFRYFRDRIKEEFQRSKTFMLPLSLLKIEIVNAESMSEEKYDVVKKLLCGIVSQRVQKLNYLVEGKFENQLYGVFPISSALHVTPHALDIESEFKRLNLQGEEGIIHLKTKVVEFEPSMETLQDFAGEFI
jgi:polysaccharide biosynthesis protein PelD